MPLARHRPLLFLVESYVGAESNERFDDAFCQLSFDFIVSRNERDKSVIHGFYFVVTFS